MSEVDYKSLLSQMFEAWNNGKVDIIDEVFTKDFIYHDPMTPNISGTAGYKKYVLDVLGSYPDFHVTVEELIQEGDILACKCFWEGTQLGESPSLGIPATGNKLYVRLAGFARISEGKIVELWMYQDWLGIMRQLGLIPAQ